jgi:hypothetical protein
VSHFGLELWGTSGWEKLGKFPKVYVQYVQRVQPNKINFSFFSPRKAMATEGGKSEGGMDEINIGVVRFDRLLLPLLPFCHV